MTGASRRTVFRLKSLVKSGQGIQRKEGSGRPQKLKANDKRRVSRLVQVHENWSAEEVAKVAHRKGSPLVSSRTIQRYLKSNGWFKLIPKLKPMLTEEHKRQRVIWCRQHQDTNWSRVFFSDESTFQFFSNKFAVWSKGKPKRKAKPKYSPKLMVWGGISMRGTTNLSVIAGTVDSRVYQNILNENIPTMSALYPDGYILQQDNARPHTSRTTIEFFKKYRLVVLKWPAGSPDLNPIENLWAIMKRKLERAQKRTISEWKAEIEKIWSDIRPDVIKSFIESMPRRIQMVIEADGKIIKY